MKATNNKKSNNKRFCNHKKLLYVLTFKMEKKSTYGY